MKNLANFLVHLFRRDPNLDQVYLSTSHELCLFCEQKISDSSTYQAFRVCPFCRFHYTMTARERVELLSDKGTFKESLKYIRSVAPLSFSRRGNYGNLLAQDQARTGLTEAAVTGRCRIGDNEVTLVVLDFGFMGGSMGGVVGEKVSLALEYAAREELPVVAVVTGGGTRIQEGILSLMQMSKTVMAANRLRDNEKPFLVVLANPATGQAYASFANLADVILAEPGSLIGLSPLRKVKEVAKKPLPLDAHTAEAHLACGLVDTVVDRESLRSVLTTLLSILGGQQQTKGNQKGLVQPELDALENPDIWQAVEMARHRDRPSAISYMQTMLDPFVELCGDRLNSDNRSVVGGVGYLLGQPLVVVGQQRTDPAQGYHVYPDGLRKAQRLIRLAMRFELPLLTLVDTQGADPGLEAEEQGIGNAIATTLSLLAEAATPIISVIIGESGSEGAQAFSLADRILMQQYAIYSPISLNRGFSEPYLNPPLDWEAAEALTLTAHDCLELGIIDQIAPEPENGAHTDLQIAATNLQLAVIKHLGEVSKLSAGKMLKRRYDKFRHMGEDTAYSLEALNQEVDLLAGISSRSSYGDRLAEANGKKSSPKRTKKKIRKSSKVKKDSEIS